jgi:threonine dehydratase
VHAGSFLVFSAALTTPGAAFSFHLPPCGEGRVGAMDESLTVENIAAAAEIIDPAFLDSPQYLSEPISQRLGLAVVLKVETINPIRSFKGRGTDYLLHRLGAPDAGYVCASAGNFGQGMAYAARKRRLPVTVFAAVNANPLKVERMRALGAEVVLEGEDFDAAKAHARHRAEATGAIFVEDGTLAPIAEGAGTIALELTGNPERLDAVLVPLGDGALINGIGAWMREKSPGTAVIGVVADGAPAMDLSWRAHKVVSTESISTIADGIAVREPVAEALREMEGKIDDIVRVSDEQIIDAMRILLKDAGLVTEPAGAAGVAAAAVLRGSYPGQRVGVIVTGGNIAADDLRRLLL